MDRSEQLNSQKAMLSKALSDALSLKDLLNNEFESLKKQDIDSFEALQQSKTDILNFLASEDLSKIIKDNTDPSAVETVSETWNELMSIISECKDLHMRNEIFINRKLESIKGALKTIQNPDPLSSVEVYDRLGKVRPIKVRQNVGKA